MSENPESASSSHRYVGRGAQSRPANRFERLHFDATEFEAIENGALENSATESEADEVAQPEFRVDESHAASCNANRNDRRIRTEYYDDLSQSIVTENRSPDIPFRYSVNIYRGCAHGCSYCYARPTHEYLGFDAGLDFESKIMVKRDAPKLLRKWLEKARDHVEPIMFSGVTDCYQPIERTLGLTRECLELCWEFRQPVMIVTKNRLVTRDIDILAKMAEFDLVHVAVSITSLDPSLVRVMEPRTSAPQARLDALRDLSNARVPSQVMVAPIIPGLNDHELPAILAKAAEHGATNAGYVLLRLPDTVRPVFLDWLQRTFPDRAGRVENRLRSMRSGRLNDAQYGSRMRGKGEFADQLAQTFRVFAKRVGMDSSLPALNVKEFRAGGNRDRQRRLF